MQFRLKTRIAALVLIPAMFALQGCISQATLASLTSTLGTNAAAIATLEGNTTLATQLTADTGAAVTAITNWKSGTPATEAIQALTIVENDLNLIPGTSQYAPLVVLCIGTVQSILALLPQPAAPVAATAVRTVDLMNPPKNAKDFKKQWNAIIAANPKLAAATIK